VATDAGFDLADAPTAAIADALGSINVLDPTVRPVWPGARVFGPAYTVQCHAQSIITVHKALLEAPSGSVLVVDGGGDAVGALFGGMMAREAKGQHLAGLDNSGSRSSPARLPRGSAPTGESATPMSSCRVADAP
jgi:regulator of RNase E activity RraA